MWFLPHRLRWLRDMAAHQMKVQHFHPQLLRLVTPARPACCSCWGLAGDLAVVFCPFQ